MSHEQALHAVLIPPQLVAFCKRFDVAVEDIEPNFTGWSKHILMTKEYVFLFPRHTKYEKSLETELQLYRVFAQLPDVPLPKLIEVVHDPNISDYRFGVVTRMSGVVFSSIELALSEDEYTQVLCELGRLIAVWHQMSLSHFSQVVTPLVFSESWEEADFYRWLCPALVPDTVNQAWEEICRLSVMVIKACGDNAFQELTTERCWSKWQAVMIELANLPSVLLHRDVHEDQFFVRSQSDLEITGLIDWGSAAIGNPVLDFNFGEWGVDIWRYRDCFGQFRTAMWKAYLEARKIRVSTYDGLHLLYTLHELHCVATRNEPSILYDSIETERQEVLTRLLAVTQKFPTVSPL